MSAVPDPIDELLEISSKASRSDVCSENNLDFAGESAFEGIDPDRDALLHVFEALRIEVSDAQKFIFVLDVVVQQESEIGIVVGPVLRHQIQYFVRKPVSVLDRGATGENCGLRSFGTLSVNDSPFAQRFCLTASGIDLSLRQRRSTAFADAFRGKDFDQIRSLRRYLPDELSDLIGCAGGFIHRT